MMNILVLGDRPVAFLTAGFLSKNHEVSWVCGEESLKGVQEAGVKISGSLGSHTFRPQHLYSSIGHLNSKSIFECVVFCGKGFETLDYAKEVEPFLKKGAFVLCFQNGLGNVEALCEVFPLEYIFPGTFNFFAWEDAQGRIQVSGNKCHGVLGCASGEVTASLKKIRKVFEDSGLSVQSTEDPESELWKRALLDCMVQGLAALLEVPCGAIASDEAAKNIVHDTCEEIFAIAKKCGISLEDENLEKFLERFYAESIPSMGDWNSQVLKDIERDVETEIDSLNGIFVRLGGELKIETPMNSFLTDLIRQKEQGYEVKLEIAEP